MKRTITLLLVVTAVQAFGQSSNARQIDSLLQIATRYLSGINRNDTIAFDKFKQCALLGHARSMNTIGNMYKRGRGVQANGNEAAYWFRMAGMAGYAQGWYSLGLHYKEMRPPSQDFQKAYECFSSGAQAGDSLCIFMKGYMHYKGFGCEQNYAEACALFRLAASKGVSNGMYFLGLCLRNGYGVTMNEDSANYWLTLAANKYNGQARMELESSVPENGNVQAKDLAGRIVNAASVEPQLPMNKYEKIEEGISAGVITGKYSGHLIKFDWSGKHVIGVSPLILELYSINGKVYGIWQEADSLKVPLTAVIDSRQIEFLNTSYSRTDYYSPKKAITYNFEKATLKWVTKGDTVSLAGNLHLFSPQRNEPHKPLSVALIKSGKEVSNEIIKFANISEALDKPDRLLAYPNPFKDIVTIDFSIVESCEVVTELLTLDGKIVYSNRAGKLQPGYYTLTINPSIKVAPGIYIIVLKYGNATKTSKVVKQ